VYERNIEASSRKHCCRRKAISITYSQCLSVALFIQHAMLMSHISLLPAVCLDVPYFTTLSYKWQDFRKKKSLNIEYVSYFPLQLLSKTFLTKRRS